MKSVGSEEEEKIGEQKPLRASSKGLETVAGQTGWTTKTRCDYYYYYYSCDVLQSRKFRLRRDARILLVADSRVSPRVFFFFFFFVFRTHHKREREHEYNHPRYARNRKLGEHGGRWRNERWRSRTKDKRGESKDNEFEKLKEPCIL